LYRSVLFHCYAGHCSLHSFPTRRSSDLSAVLRDQITRTGSATLMLDLAPDRSAERVLAEVTHPRGSRSLSSHLQSKAGIAGVKADRKSTRLNSSHVKISYAVFCLKKKKY